PFDAKFELLSDGREVAETDRGRRTVSSLRWDGDALVVTFRSQGPDGEGDNLLFVMNYRKAGVNFEPWNRSAVVAKTRTICGYSSDGERHVTSFCSHGGPTRSAVTTNRRGAPPLPPLPTARRARRPARSSPCALLHRPPAESHTDQSRRHRSQPRRFHDSGAPGSTR